MKVQQSASAKDIRFDCFEGSTYVQFNPGASNPSRGLGAIQASRIQFVRYENVLLRDCSHTSPLLVLCRLTKFWIMEAFARYPETRADTSVRCSEQLPRTLPSFERASRDSESPCCDSEVALFQLLITHSFSLVPEDSPKEKSAVHVCQLIATSIAKIAKTKRPVHVRTVGLKQWRDIIIAISRFLETSAHEFVLALQTPLASWSSG